jgi:hypothetical protein
MTTPGVEPGLSRPQRDVLTTRRCGPCINFMPMSPRSSVRRAHSPCIHSPYPSHTHAPPDPPAPAPPPPPPPPPPHPPPPPPTTHTHTHTHTNTHRRTHTHTHTTTHTETHRHTQRDDREYERPRSRLSIFGGTWRRGNTFALHAGMYCIQFPAC